MTNTQTLKYVANLLNTNPAWLTALISFESNFDPQAKNPVSSAKGLIQFMDATAQGMGFSSSQDLIDKFPDFESQMKGPVYDYLKQWAPFPTKQSLYMAVFYPAYRNKSPDTAFSASVKASNPGIDTVADYINYVEKRAGNVPPEGGSEPGGNLIPLLLVGIIAYLYFTS